VTGSIPAEHIDDLSTIPVLSTLSRQDLADLAAECDWRRFLAGDYIIDKVDSNHDVFFLIKGRAQVENHTLIGTAVRLSDIVAGSYFGELSAIDGGPRSAEVRAMEECLVVALSPDAFRRLLTRHPSMLITVLQNLAAMVRHTNATVLTHATL
jgi:CRP/FNR family cyclic AMP-dependent transcriptional regulator